MEHATVAAGKAHAVADRCAVRSIDGDRVASTPPRVLDREQAVLGVEHVRHGVAE